MKFTRNGLRTAGSVAAIAVSCNGVWADSLADSPLIGTSGGGLIFSDPEEGVLAPGIKAVTFTRTRVDGENPGEFDYIDPFEVIITDFSEDNPDVESRGDVTNCLMANNPDIYCDSESGSGKRIKVQLTGADPFDMTFATIPNGAVFDAFGAPVDTSSVDYFTFGKLSNFTGARMIGFALQLLDANGDLMGSSADDVSFNLDATQIGLGSGLPDGLFGEGGNEGEIGFFSDQPASLGDPIPKATFALTPAEDTLTFGALSNTNYTQFFGTAFLDDTMVPDGLFWDDNTNPDDEAALVAWDNLAGGGWTYGTLAPDAPQTEARLAELASALGVSVVDLAYAPEALVPAAIVAAAQASGAFAIDPIEDLRNTNLNYTLTIGTVDGGEFTLRTLPVFAPIVQEALSAFQFRAAGYLDAAANIPYWDLGNAGAYQTAISDILALEEAEQAQAVTSTGFSIAPAFVGLGFETGRNQVAALMNMAPLPERAEVPVAQFAGARSWSIGDGLYGLFAAGGSTATYDTTSQTVGYDLSATSFTMGLEKSLNGNASVGLALGAESAKSDAAADLGDVETTGVSLTGFVRSQLGNGASVRALLGYQDLSYSSTRAVLGATAEGSADGSQIFGAVSVDYLRDFGAVRFGPTASFAFYDVSVDGFTETGGGIWNLEVAEQSTTTVLGTIGLAGEYLIPAASGDTRLTGSIAYAALSGDDLVVQSGFVGLPSAAFPVQGRDENLIDVTFGFDSVLSSTASRDIVLRGAYGGSFGDTYSRHGVQVGLDIQF